MKVSLLVLLYFITYVLSANITINWNNVLGISKTSTTLQVVVNPQLRRGASMHDGAFDALKMLKADYVRFVPWLPYPRLGVAELRPPAGKTVCGSVEDNGNLYLSCYEGVIEDVVFASYGTPGGSCGAFTHGKCGVNPTTAINIVKGFCLDQQACLVPAQSGIFSEPCANTAKWMSVQISCSNPQNRTFWDFSLIDPMMEDLMVATEGKKNIINFSTVPEWMWNTDAPVLVPADPNQLTWSYSQGWELRDYTFKEIGDYFERLVAWYTNGGFYDEFGRFRRSNHYYKIPMWEVLNEVEQEHNMSPQYYTKVYDAVVRSIQKVQPNMEFVGMALAGRNANYTRYFLNASNHQPGIPIHWISYHFYASSVLRNDTTGYQNFFKNADGFFTEVDTLETIRKQLSPNTKVTINEIGVILPYENNVDAEPIPDLYWNAAGAMFAYIYGNLAPKGIDVLGESQLIGYPTQFPSVSMIRYPDGAPNARYWVLYLLHKHFSVGDKMIYTVSNDVNVFGAAYDTSAGRRVLVVNKTNMRQTAYVNLKSGQMEVVDSTTGFSPPRITSITGPTISLLPYAVVVVSITNLVSVV